MASLRSLPRPHRRGLALVRVSKERDGMTSPEVQRHAIQTYADAHDITITDWVEGIDESGSNIRSAWWAKLDASIARIEAGEADVIVVWKFSRVGRQRLRWAIALDKVDTAGGAIESATEPSDATPSGRFARGMLGELNAYQAELIGETWRETHDRRRRAGLPHGNHHRFGYQLVDGRFEPDPHTGPILAEMYRRALRGDGAGRITRWLNESSIPTTLGNPWVSSNLYQLLDGGFGAGLIVHRPGWKQKRLPKSAWTFYPGAHPAVIEPHEWAAYWARRLELSEPSRSIEARHLLTGLIYCADCGGRVHYTHGRYVCTTATRTKGTARTRRIVTINSTAAEAAVEAWVSSLADDTDALLSAREATRARHVRSVNDADAIQRRLTKIDTQLAALTIRQLDPDEKIPESAYQATIRKLDAERASLTERHATLDLAARRREVNAREVALTLRDTWGSLETHTKRQALLGIVSAVLIRPGDQAPRVLVIPRWEARG